MFLISSITSFTIIFPFFFLMKRNMKSSEKGKLTYFPLPNSGIKRRPSAIVFLAVVVALAKLAISMAAPVTDNTHLSLASDGDVMNTLQSTVGYSCN